MYQSFTYTVGSQNNNVYRDLATALMVANAAKEQITVNVKQTVVTEFQGIHEVIGDMLRNHCQNYKILACYCDARDELVKRVIEPSLDLEHVIQWIIHNGNEFREARYSYNRIKSSGIYCLSCDVTRVRTNNPIGYHIIELS